MMDSSFSSEAPLMTFGSRSDCPGPPVGMFRLNREYDPVKRLMRRRCIASASVATGMMA